MDNFENQNQESKEGDSQSESSYGNNLLYQFIFGEKDSTSHTQKAEKNEYQINISTSLKEPSERRRQCGKFRRLGLKRTKHSSIFRRSTGSGIKGRPPKHIVSQAENTDPNSTSNKHHQKFHYQISSQLSLNLRLTLFLEHICHVSGCEKIFTDASSFRKHMITHGERQYMCPVEGCGKRFLDNSKLKRHQLVHTGEKPYVCDLCHKKFSLDFNLKTHLRTHTGEKPYLCTYPGCNKRFTQSSNLTAHEKTHSCPREFNGLVGPNDGHQRIGYVSNGELFSGHHFRSLEQGGYSSMNGYMNPQYVFLITFKPRQKCSIHLNLIEKLQKEQEQECEDQQDDNGVLNSLHEREPSEQAGSNHLQQDNHQCSHSCDTASNECKTVDFTAGMISDQISERKLDKSSKCEILKEISNQKTLQIFEDNNSKKPEQAAIEQELQVERIEQRSELQKYVAPVEEEEPRGL